MSKKYTRKQLKQPDEFISFSAHAWEWLHERLPQTMVAIGVAIVVVAGVQGWGYFAKNRAMKSTSFFSKMLGIYEKPTWSGQGNFAPASDDGIPQFKSRKEKLEAVEKEVGETLNNSGGQMKAMATLVQAGVLYDQGKFDAAISAYQNFLSSAKDHQFDALALEGLALAYEAQKNYDRALEFVRRLPQEGDARYQSLYHEARLLAAKGQKTEAAKMFEQVMSKASSTTLQERASEQLAALEN